MAIVGQIHVSQISARMEQYPEFKGADLNLINIDEQVCNRIVSVYMKKYTVLS